MASQTSKMTAVYRQQESAGNPLWYVTTVILIMSYYTNNHADKMMIKFQIWAGQNGHAGNASNAELGLIARW